MSDKGASRFDRERNYAEFVALKGFHPQELEWVPLPCERDLRDNRDPLSIGRKLVGKKKVLTAADRYAKVAADAAVSLAASPRWVREATPPR